MALTRTYKIGSSQPSRIAISISFKLATKIWKYFWMHEWSGWVYIAGCRVAQRFTDAIHKFSKRATTPSHANSLCPWYLLVQMLFTANPRMDMRIPGSSRVGDVRNWLNSPNCGFRSSEFRMSINNNINPNYKFQLFNFQSINIETLLLQIDWQVALNKLPGCCETAKFFSSSQCVF